MWLMIILKVIKKQENFGITILGKPQEGVKLTFSSRKGKVVDFDLEITFGIVLIGYSKLLLELKSLILLSTENTDKSSELAFKILA